MRQNYPTDREKNLRSLEQFVQTVKGQNNFLVTDFFYFIPGGFSDIMN